MYVKQDVYMGPKQNQSTPFCVSGPLLTVLPPSSNLCPPNHTVRPGTPLPGPNQYPVFSFSPLVPDLGEDPKTPFLTRSVPSM